MRMADYTELTSMLCGDCGEGTVRVVPPHRRSIVAYALQQPENGYRSLDPDPLVDVVRSCDRCGRVSIVHFDSVAVQPPLNFTLPTSF